MKVGEPSQIGRQTQRLRLVNSAVGRDWRRRWLSLISVLSLLLVAAVTYPIDPLGGQVYLYQQEETFAVNASGRLKLDQNQVISILITQPVPFNGQFSLRRDSDDVLIVSREVVSGQPLLVQSVLIDAPSTFYTFNITAPSGRYNLVIVSSALEEEPYTGVSNNTPQNTPQNLASSFILFERLQRGAVRGELKDTSDVDLFSFRLNAGDHVELALSTLGNSIPQIELLDANASPVAALPFTGDNFDKLLAYDVSSNGTYLARISGATSANLNYNLVIVRSGVFSREPNASFESAQVITNGGVLGSVNVPPLEGSSQSSFSEKSLSVGFSSKGVFDYDATNQNSTIGLRWEDIEYLGSGGGQFSSFTFCYLQESTRICPVHQFKGQEAPQLSYANEDTISGQHFFIVEGRTSEMHFRRVVQWRKDKPWVVVNTQLTNLGSVPLIGLQALESIKPNPGGVAATNNDIIAAGGDGLDMRVAQASNAHGALVMGASDLRAKASFVDGDIADPNLVLANPVDPQGALSNLAMHLAFDLHDVPVGQRADYTFVMALSPVSQDIDTYRQVYLQSKPDSQVMGLDNLYAIDLEAGRRLLAHTILPFKANLSTYNNRLDPVLKLYGPGPQHALLLVNDDCRDNPLFHCADQSNVAQLEYDIQESGRYYLQVTNSAKTSLYGESSAVADRAGGEFVMLVHHSNPPTIVPIPKQMLDLAVGDLLTLQVQAPDSDEDDTIIFSLEAGAPQGAKIDEKTGFLEWQPTQVGNYFLTVVAEDQTWLRATYTIEVEVFRTTWPLYLPAVLMK